MTVNDKISIQMNVSLPLIYASFLKLSSALTEEDTYSVIIEEACSLVNAEYGSIFIADQRKRLKRVYSTSPRVIQFVPRPRGYCYTCFAKKIPLVIPGRNILAAHPEFKEAQAKIVVMVPLAFDGESLGVLTLDCMKQRRFTRRNLQIIQMFGSLVSIKIKNSLLISRMKSALETRDLFISMASHELKTPLTTISAYAQLIDKKIVTKQPVKSEWADTLILATKRMTRLINELLQINQIRTGNMPYHFQICKIKTIIDTGLVKTRADFSLIL